MIKSFFLTAALSSLIFISSFAQKRADEIKKLMWESGDPACKVVDVPEKWKNESAVILFQRHYHEYRKEVYLVYLYQKEYLHKRVKLQDKSAVAEFSEISYPEDPLNYFIGIKVIKPSGSETIVDLKSAVVMEKEMNGYKQKYNKIAVPSLEPGDIIDYYICMERSIMLQSKIYTFSNVIYNLQEKYPIVKQELEFKLKRRCFLNIKLYNGAPELKVKEDPADEATIYYLTDTDREKVSEKLWHYPYRSLPTVKFQVRYASPSSESYFNFMGSATVPKTSITKEEIVEYVNKIVVKPGFYATSIETYLKKYHKTETDPEKIIQAAYNYYRYLKFQNVGLFYYFYNNDPELEFVQVMSSIMKKRKIPHEVLIYVPRHISTIDQAVLQVEFSLLLKVNTSKPFYLSPFGAHSLMKDIEPSVQGAEAYAINIADPKLKNTATKIKVPVVSHLENNSFHKINITIDEKDFSTIKARVEATLKGQNKSDEQSSFVNIYDYGDAECKALNEKTDLEKIKKEKDKAEFIKKEDREKEEYNERKEKALKADAENNFDAKILSVKNFTLKEIGRWPEHPEMIYTEDIEMEGLLKKVGPNYILEAGKLIGSQVELTEEDKKRKFDVYMSYARSFNNEITIQIPDGYVVEGIETFNIDKKNKTGGFVSSATVTDNKLVINTQKYYVNNFEKAEDWPLIEEFLEAAYNFTQQKILLKKK